MADSHSDYLELTAARDDLKKKCSELEDEVERLRSESKQLAAYPPEHPMSQDPPIAHSSSIDFLFEDGDAPELEPDTAAGRFIVDDQGVPRGSSPTSVSSYF